MGKVTVVLRAAVFLVSCGRVTGTAVRDSRQYCEHEKGANMRRRFITDNAGLFTCEVEAHGLVLEEAIEHDDAEEVLKCAVIIALSVLAQDGPWPDALMERMSSFMVDMKKHVMQEELL